MKALYVLRPALRCHFTLSRFFECFFSETCKIELGAEFADDGAWVVNNPSLAVATISSLHTTNQQLEFRDPVRISTVTHSGNYIVPASLVHKVVCDVSDHQVWTFWPEAFIPWNRQRLMKWAASRHFFKADLLPIGKDRP